MQLHHLKNSRSQRIIWLMEELNLDYEVVFHQRDVISNRAGKSLSDIHPLGKAPVLCDDQIAIAETGAIIDYLLEHYASGQLQPSLHSDERHKFHYWRHFAEGSLMPYLSMKILFHRITTKAPIIVRPLIAIIFRKVNRDYLDPTLYDEVNFIEAHLKHNLWFAGENFTAADILMGFMLEALSGRFATTREFPLIANYVTRIRARPSYQRATLKGDWSSAEFDSYWGFLSKK